MTTNYLFFLVILTITMLFSIIKGKLTPGAAFAAGTIGLFVFAGTNFTGIAMIGLFFLLGTLATDWKIEIKQSSGDAEPNNGKRNVGQVLANGGVAGIAGLLILTLPEYRSLLQLMMAAALASATADTTSSELGTVYGRVFYNIIGFKKGKRGENGVVSIEGTIIGIIGSTLIAIVFSIGFGWGYQFGIIVIAGTIGNVADSVLGATLERDHLLKNDAVNFINTAIAALSAAILFQFFNDL